MKYLVLGLSIVFGSLTLKAQCSLNYLQSKDKRFGYNCEGNGPAGFSYKLNIQWWALMGEPVESYRLNWDVSENFYQSLFPSDLSAFPDLFKRSRSIKPFKVVFEVDATLQHAEGVLSLKKEINSDGFIIPRKGQDPNLTVPESPEWEEFFYNSNRQALNNADVGKVRATFRAYGNVRINNIRIAELVWPENEIKSIINSYNNRVKRSRRVQKEQRSRAETLNKEELTSSEYLELLTEDSLINNLKPFTGDPKWLESVSIKRNSRQAVQETQSQERSSTVNEDSSLKFKDGNCYTYVYLQSSLKQDFGPKAVSNQRRVLITPIFKIPCPDFNNAQVDIRRQYAEFLMNTPKYRRELEQMRDQTGYAFSKPMFGIPFEEERAQGFIDTYNNAVLKSYELNPEFKIIMVEDFKYTEVKYMGIMPDFYKRLMNFLDHGDDL